MPTAYFKTSEKEQSVAKDKKKKNKGKGKGKPGAAASSKAASSLRLIAQNPMVADIVAAALVSTAVALKDSKKARDLAGQAGDELGALATEGVERGNALWQLALDVGRRAIETLAGDAKAKSAKSPRKSAAKPAKKSPRKAKSGAAKSKAD